MTTLFVWEPFYGFERQGQKACNQGQRNEAVRSFKPRLDLHEDNEKNLVTATFEFPGFSKEDIKIDVHYDKLHISAESKQSVEHNDENGYVVRERRFGKYSRTLQLPRGVKDEDVKAAMENGVLVITFPKATPEIAPTQIAIA